MDKNRYYVCSPLKAPSREGVRNNMCEAKAYMEVVERLTKGIAFAPHSFLPAYLDDYDPRERTLCMEFGFEYLKLCAGLVVCGDTCSDGMAEEIQKAREAGVPVWGLSMAFPIQNYFRMINRNPKRTLVTESMYALSSRIIEDVRGGRIKMVSWEEWDDTVRNGKEDLLQSV